MGAGRIAAIVVGTSAVVLALLLLPEPFTYEVVQDCPPGDSICRRESRSGFYCSAPLWGDKGQPDPGLPEQQDRCERGRAWRRAIYGGAGVAGVLAILVATVSSSLTNRARRSRPSA